MNEAETRAEYIDPKLKDSGWGVVEGSKVLREYRFTDGKIMTGGLRGKPDIADYVLVYKNIKLSVIEAKKAGDVKEGVGQAKDYALKLSLPYAYSTDGLDIYEINIISGKEKYISTFPTPDQLWQLINSDQNDWKDKFAEVPLEGQYGTRYYQEIAINKALDAIAEKKDRLLLTLATGTGKTAIAFQISWKLFQSRWNLNRDGGRRPRILFLADRNILANQAFNAFSLFPEDALVRISPSDIRKKGAVPTNGSIFFTIFQTFTSGPNDTPYFGDYPPDFFDLIIIDECHRGGANDESNWRGIMEYFSPAVQLGLTATPKRKDNIDTYRYFGEPLYTYSLKQGVNDGFLTPFKVKRVETTLDDYIYTSDDKVIEGEVEEGKLYKEEEFNRTIEIEERERKRVLILLEEINQKEKTIIFCANQGHAALIRDLINQNKESSDPQYCVRVTANDGKRGEQFLREFQDNEKTIPTILTTSQKLSTGVDARNVRNIILLRPVNSMIEFKQIIGRGTRLFDGKEYFTIIDFVDAYHHFLDPEWDGEPINEVVDGPDLAKINKRKPPTIISDPELQSLIAKKIKIKLRDGKEREIQHMISTSFWSANGKPISMEEFLDNLYGFLPSLFGSKEDLRIMWSQPKTRGELLEKLVGFGYGSEELGKLQQMINAQDSDLFDALSYWAFGDKPISRQARVDKSRSFILGGKDDNKKEFIEFVLDQYLKAGIDDLSEEKLPQLLILKYHAIADAEEKLGSLDEIRTLFFDLQKNLYLN